MPLAQLNQPEAWRLEWLETKDTEERAAWVARFRDGNETLGEVVKAVMETRKEHWTYTSKGTCHQDQHMDTLNSDLNNSKESKPWRATQHLRSLQLSPGYVRRHQLQLLQGLQDGGEEVTFTALAAVFKFNDKVTNLFLAESIDTCTTFSTTSKKRRRSYHFYGHR